MSIGRVLNTAFGAIFGNLYAMLGIAFLFSGLPRGLVAYFQQSALPSLGNGQSSPGTFVWIVVAGTLVTMLFTVIAQGALIGATMAASRGEKAGYGECLATGFQRMLSLIGLTLVSGVAFVFAAILFIVPAIILTTIWYVAAPLVVAERSGVFAALGRSAELTKGERWSVFVVLLIMLGFFLLVFMLTSVVSGIGIAVGARNGDFTGLALLTAVAAAISTTLQTVLATAISTAVYIELRELKEGPETQGLDAVFA
ncbi:MAG TPA: hypothetical protein VN137_03055 [Sphingomonas sp.]|nr:hypothetical protein [Sphingomonas sp.]